MTLKNYIKDKKMETWFKDENWKMICVWDVVTYKVEEIVRRNLAVERNWKFFLVVFTKRNWDWWEFLEPLEISLKFWVIIEKAIADLLIEVREKVKIAKEEKLKRESLLTKEKEENP